jgi:hypothetical protein
MDERRKSNSIESVIGGASPSSEIDNENENRNMDENWEVNTSFEERLDRNLSQFTHEVKNTISSLSETMSLQFENVSLKLHEMQERLEKVEDNSSSKENRIAKESETKIVNHNVHSLHKLPLNGKTNTTPKIKPQLFDGNIDIDEYLTQFNIVAEINGWNNHEKALYLASSLSGVARSLLSELENEQRTNYDTLVRALFNRFGSINRAEIFRSKLKSRYQEKGETLPELAQNIRKLTRLAYPSASTEVVEILAIEQFTEAINDSDIRLRLREQGLKTMSEVETLAVKLEAHRIADRQRNRMVGSVQENGIKEFEDCKQNCGSDELKQSFEKLTSTIDELVQQVKLNQQSNKSQNSHGQRYQINGRNYANQSRERYGSFNHQQNNIKHNWGDNSKHNLNYRSNYDNTKRFQGDWRENRNQNQRHYQENWNGASKGTETRPFLTPGPQ